MSRRQVNASRDSAAGLNIAQAQRRAALMEIVSRRAVTDPAPCACAACGGDDHGTATPPDTLAE